MKRFYVYILICLGFVLGCKKDKNNSPTAEKLKAGLWQISASTITLNYNGKDTSMDYYSGWRACEQDDLTKFDDDGKGTTNENTDKCPEDEQVGHFNWELTDNNTKLKITLDGSAVFASNNAQTMISDIVEVSGSRLILKVSDMIDSIPATFTETYKNVR